MFKLCPDPTFWTSVAIPIPGGEPGTIEVECAHMGREAFQAFIEDAKSGDDLTTCAAIVRGWKGIDAEFSAEALAELLDNYPAAAGQIVRAYSEELVGARRKN